MPFKLESRPLTLNIPKGPVATGLGNRKSKFITNNYGYEHSVFKDIILLTFSTEMCTVISLNHTTEACFKGCGNQ